MQKIEQTIDMSVPAPRSGAVWIGRALSTAAVLFLAGDAAICLFAPHILAANMAATGFPSDLAFPLGLLLLACTIVYAVPRTSALGAILLTGFLGGAICTHVRVGEIGSPPQLICLLLGAMAWGGLYLRDTRVSALIPLRVLERP